MTVLLHTHTHRLQWFRANTVGVYMSGSDDVDVVENIFYAPPQPPGVTEHYTFHACIEMDDENRNARVNCNTFQQPYYGIKLTNAIVDDFGNSSVGANNVFMQNVQWTMVPIQNAIYGDLQSGTCIYYADAASATVINGFLTGTRPDQFGDDDVTPFGNFSVVTSLGIDGCDPDPLPTDELNITEKRLSSNKFQVFLYPNPSAANGEIKIEVSEKSQARVFDVHGKEIVAWELRDGVNHKPINLPGGVYFIAVSSKNKNKTIKWIVQ